MISTTVNSIPVFLVTQSPDWEAGVQGDFIKQTIRDESVSNREEREPTAEKLRATLKYKSVLSATDAATLRTILAAWDNRPVLCPFWPAESLIADAGSASVQGALRVWYEPDWSAWDIGTGAGPGFTPSADCLTAPVLWGRFDSFPDQRVATGADDEIVTFSLLENGSADYALEPPAVTLTNGDSVNGQTVPLMTPTFAWGTNSEQIEVRIKRAKIGYGREDADTYYTQEPRTKHTLLFDWLEDSTAPAYLLALFADRGGSIAPWWAIAAHSTTARIFGRFYTDRLSIMWDRPNRCGGEWGSCKVEFLTLPNEETVPAGETFGETLGPKPAKVFLYLTTDGTITDRSTSYESALAGPGGTYTPRKITHGKIIEEINLQKNDCTLTVDHWTGGPFARLLQHPNSAPLTVTIYEAYLDALEDAAPIYTGTCQAPKINQSQMKINLRGPGAILSTEGPRMLLQQDCNATFCDVRCGLDIADFTETADLLSFSDGVAKMDAAFSDHPESYFQNGFVERTIGGVPQRYLIADSYDFGDGKLALVLIGTVLPAITGAESDWNFAPGCDGKFSTCRDRFSNAVNFRGAPYLPNDNPSMLVLPQTQQGGKK